MANYFLASDGGMNTGQKCQKRYLKMMQFCLFRQLRKLFVVEENLVQP